MNMLIRLFILMRLLKREQTDAGKSRATPSSASNTVLSHDTLFKPFHRAHRILPHDMGFRDHLPNYRYLSFIELNVTGWLYRLLTQKGKDGMSLNWIISMQEMVYLNEVKLFDKMTVTSTLEGWDKKYVYFQHHFFVKNELMAIGLTKFVIMDEDKMYKPDILDMQGEHLSDVINTWNANQKAIKQQ